MNHLGLYLIFACLGFSSFACTEEVQITVDSSEAPELSQWAEDGAVLMKEWYPRLSNLLSSPDFEPPAEVTLRIRRSDKGVGATSGTKIVVSSSWIEKHPGDVGLLIHELVHVIQNYPAGKGPIWVTKGIADYLHWAIFEGKSAAKFPVPKDPQGYKKGYQPTAGFFLWLETKKAPGIVCQFNTAMRNGQYSPDIFVNATSGCADASKLKACLAGPLYSRSFLGFSCWMPSASWLRRDSVGRIAFFGAKPRISSLCAGGVGRLFCFWTCVVEKVCRLTAPESGWSLSGDSDWYEVSH